MYETFRALDVEPLRSGLKGALTETYVPIISRDSSSVLSTLQNQLRGPGMFLRTRRRPASASWLCASGVQGKDDNSNLCHPLVQDALPRPHRRNLPSVQLQTLSPNLTLDPGRRLLALGRALLFGLFDVLQ